MTREPRPAFVSVGELFGGVERHLLGMCTWMKRQGRQPLLILFYDRELARQSREIGVEPVILKTSGRFDLGAPRQLAEILAKHRINVVHAHGYRAMVNAALARRSHQFAVVRTVHGLVEGQGLFSIAALKGRLYTWLERVASRATRATVCYVTKDLQQFHATVDRRFETKAVYNGIDPLEPEACARPVDLDPTVYHFAAVGRVSQVKGLSYALRAMSKVDPALNMVLDIIGTGPLEDQLKNEAADLELGARVQFLGFKENIYDYLAHIDCLIMPSLHEGLPYTILETMSLGVPILASRIGGLAEILDHRENALLFEVGDVGAIAALMRELVNNTAMGMTLGEAGRKKQNTELDLEHMGSSYWSIYEAFS